MKNFDYCIWLTTLKKNNKWFHYTNGFQPHITLKYNLSLDEANLFLNTIEKNKKYTAEPLTLTISLSDKLYYSCDEEDNFYCLYKKAYLLEDKIPDWFPLDAHVSFYYSYYPISNEILKNLEKDLEKEKTNIFDTIQIKLCNDHFLLW
jgi:hypothetical protein